MQVSGHWGGDEMSTDRVCGASDDVDDGDSVQESLTSQNITVEKF